MLIRVQIPKMRTLQRRKEAWLDCKPESEADRRSEEHPLKVWSPIARRSSMTS